MLNGMTQNSHTTKFWYLNNILHSTDGPAIEYVDGYKAWFLNDKELTEEQFNSPSYREFLDVIS